MLAMFPVEKKPDWSRKKKNSEVRRESRKERFGMWDSRVVHRCRRSVKKMKKSPSYEIVRRIKEGEKVRKRETRVDVTGW